MDWRATADGVEWSDGGPIELRLRDGRCVTATMALEEFWTGEDEVPVPVLEDAPKGVNFFDAEAWRPLG